MEGEEEQKSEPVLAWMRDPVDIDLYQAECPLRLVPGLDPRLVMALQNMGISSLYPVQSAVWQETIGPGALERDLCVNSPTGSGKTLAYALPIVQMLSTRSLRLLRALVVLPTRDLALQVKEVFAAIAPAVGLHVGLAVGQTSITDEIAELVKKPAFEFSNAYDPEDLQLETSMGSSVDILIATPGRLMDHVNTTKGFTLEHLCYLVVDETDRLLREAYQSWLPTVLHLSQLNTKRMVACPRSAANYRMPGCLTTIRRMGVERDFNGKCYPRLVKMILSATLTRDPSKLSQLDLHHPLLMTSGGSRKRYQLPEQLESIKLFCESKLKPLYLVALLQGLKEEKSIIFTSSIESTQRLSILLKCFTELPLKISQYSRLQRQSVRSNTLDAFRAGELQVLVASDAMTRGMDVDGIANVINYDMPNNVKTYIHRAGRTARAGRPGRCFTLLRREEITRYRKLLKKAGSDGSRTYSIPVETVENLRPVYSSALEKLKEKVQSEKSRRRFSGSLSARTGNQKPKREKG
ncbi:hypothetical protein AMTRI_Chr09g15790 [Amborella trichopoda]